MSRVLVGLVLSAIAVAAVWSGRREGATTPGTGLEVVVVGLDGTHLALLSPLLAEGKLPNLHRYLERAAFGTMDSPVHEGFVSPALWTTMVTGVEPYRHGISDFVLPEPTTCVDVAAASGHRTAPALWNMLTEHGLRAGIIGLWATWPAETIDGAIVSDHVTYSRMRLSDNYKTAPGLEPIPFDYDTAARNVSPARLEATVNELVRLPSEIEPALLRRFADFTDAEVDAIIEGAYVGGFNHGTDALQELKVAAQSDRSYRDIALRIRDEVDPNLLWVYLEGIDALEHKFWPYHDPDFPRPVDGERSRLADVLNHYVEYVDELIAPLLALADEDTVVLVVSDHGYATVADPNHATGHWHNRNAILFAAGGPIIAGPLKGEAATIYDVTPTVLALLGLPIARDMPGRVLTDMIDREFLAIHALQWVDSYGTRRVVPGDISSSLDDPMFIQRMTQLGYLGADRSSDDRPIELARWTHTPHVFGRLATPCDVERGRAAFVSDSGSAPVAGVLPRCAIYTDDRGAEHPVIVIQMEALRARTRVGFRFLDGKAGRADGDRIELLPGGPDARFRS